MKMLNKNLIKYVFAAGLVVASAGLSAEPYLGANLAMLDVGEADLKAVYLRGGFAFNENISAEVRLGMGVGDDTYNAGPFDYKTELENAVGAYLRGGIAISDAFAPYVVIGYTRAETKESYRGFVSGSDSYSENDLSYGVGADLAINKGLKINFEFMQYLNKDDFEADGSAIGVAKHF